MEGLTYGLINDYNIVIVPMGPKIFSFFSLLLGLLYPGQLAIWRVEQSRDVPPDAKPAAFVVWSKLDCLLLKERLMKLDVLDASHPEHLD